MLSNPFYISLHLVLSREERTPEGLSAQLIDSDPRTGNNSSNAVKAAHFAGCKLWSLTLSSSHSCTIDT